VIKKKALQNSVGLVERTRVELCFYIFCWKHIKERDFW